MSSAKKWEEAKTAQVEIENCWVKLLSKGIAMEHTTKREDREDDANSDITDDLDIEKGKINNGKTLYIPCWTTWNIVYGTETKLT